MRRIRFSRYGIAENPVGEHVRWETGDTINLGTVTDVYKRTGYAGGVMLRIQFLNGEQAPDIAASAVYVLEQSTIA